MENESNETVEVNTLPLGSPEEMSLQATENNEVLVSEASEIATQGAKNEEKKVKKHSFKTWFKNHIPTKRRIIQYYSALLFNANIKGFVASKENDVILKGSASKNVCTPGLNCYSCPGATTACPLGSLQNAMTSSDKSTAYYIIGIILLYAIIAGRWICGWLCPFGLIQELFHKIKTPKVRKSKITRLLSYFKYVILAFFVFIIPLMYSLRSVPLPAFCKYICPAGTFEGAMGILANKVSESKFRMLGPLFTWKFVLLISFIVGSVFIFRFFCRFFCPLGALYGLFNKFSFFGIKLDKDKCTSCGLCITKCEMDIKHVGDHECISCGECVDVCPTKAISFKGAKIFIKDNEIDTPVSTEKVELTPLTVVSAKQKGKIIATNITWNSDGSFYTIATAEITRTNEPCKAKAIEKQPKKKDTAKKRKTVKIIVASVMAAILIGTLVYFNFIHKNPEVPQGCEVGDACFGQELEIVDENGVSGDTFNPAEYTGKVTVINFWGTWCTPCVQELPHFDAVASEYKNTVNVVAVHSTLLSQTAQGYIDQFYKDSDMIFVLDTKLDPSDKKSPDSYFSALGGTDSWPMTVVLDRNGVIVAHFVGSLTHDELVDAVEQALGNK